MDEARDHEKQPLQVAHAERNASPIEPPQRKRTAVEKLGIYNIVILVLGTLGVFLALAFLLFVWIQAGNARRHSHYTNLWFLIVWNGWTSKVVTLSTVLIRLATGTQLGVFAALVAALILERVGASTTDLPQLSMIRCANTGPHSLFRHVIHSVPVKSQLGYSIIIVITILNAAVLQLTSTILLTDVSSAYVLREWEARKIPLGFDFIEEVKNTWNGIDYWTTGPATYPRFAEYTKDGSRGANYIDTGLTYRGFLPFGSETSRSAVRNYTGPMTVVDARTVCVKPSLSDTSYYGGFSQSIAGTLRFKGVPDLLLDENGGVLFNCSVPISNSLEYWAISLCWIRVNQTGAPLWSPIMSQTLDRAHLFINFTLNGYFEDSQLQANFSLESSETSDALWARLGHGNVTIDTSLCFFDADSSEFKARAWSLDYEYLYNYRDLTLYWNPTDKKYNVETILDTFGATDKELTRQQRGVYVLEGTDIKDENVADKVYNVSTNRYLYSAVDKLYNTELNSSALQFADFGDVHRSHIVIVQNILKTTRNPALALQTLFTIIYQMAYYDFFTEFDLSAPAMHSDLESVIMPTGWIGFGVVLGLLGIHFVLLAGVLVLFLTRTEMSLLGNAWQAVSQVHSVDTADVVQKGATATDDELYGKKSKDGTRVRIAKSASSGRTEAMFVRQRHEAGNASGDEV